MFKYDWSRFNTRMGLIFMVGVLVVFSLMRQFDFAVLAAGVSALLGWITVIMAPQRTWGQHILGLVVYLVGGTALTWLADVMAPYEWGRPLSMALVTFAGYLLLLRGLHPFMVAWCLVYWYLLVPMFLGDKGLSAVVLGHVVGVGLVIGLNLMKPVWSRATRTAKPVAEPEEQLAQEHAPLGLVVRFASVVSLCIFAGLAAGARLLSSDPTLIANATLNIITPSLQQTWHAAVERVVAGTLGLLGGFYFGWLFADPWVGLVVTAVCSFLALGMLYVNAGLLSGILFFMVAYSWGTMRSDLAHQIGNEKLLSELAGVAIAVVAVALLTWLQRDPVTSSDEG